MSLKELAPTYYTRLQEVMKEVDEPNRLLNAGCGDGLYDYFLKKKAKKIISFDLNKGDIQIAKATNTEANVFYYVGNIEKISNKSNTFDCVICVDVLEHLKRDREAIKELVRVLKKGGKLIVSVPSEKFPFFYDPMNYVLNRIGEKLSIGAWSWGHERLYTVKTIEKKFKVEAEKTKYLSHSLVGLIENGYVNSFLQGFVKNDPRNLSRVSKNVDRIKRSVAYNPPRFLIKIRDLIIWLDERLFYNSKESIGIMVVFKK